MTSKDLKTKIALVNLLEPQDNTDTDTASSILDTLGFESAVLAVHVGDITGVDGSNYLVPVLQESDTTANADFAEVAAGDIIGGFTKIDSTTEDKVIQYVGYKGTKRYLRVNLDWTGTTVSAAPIAVMGILGDARDEPVTVPAPVSAT